MSVRAESIHPRAQSFLTARERAEKRGDWNMVRCMNVELSRMGYVDPATVQAPNGNGATVTVEKPVRKGGRPKLPRCEHGLIEQRCDICNGLAPDPDEQNEPALAADAALGASGPFSEPSEASDVESITDDAGEPTEPYEEPVV